MRGSSGQLVPGYRAKLTDENGMEVPVGEIGDLLISSDALDPHEPGARPASEKGGENRTCIANDVTGDNHYSTLPS